MARKNAIVSVEVSDDLNAISFNVDGHAPILLDVTKLSAPLLNRATLHGLTQKVSDAAAIKFEANETDAEKAEAKHAAMLATVERLLTGEWNKRGDSDGSTPVGGIIFAALRAAKPSVDVEKLRVWYDAKTRAEQLALRNVPEIAAEIERIKAERGSKSKVDGDAVLSELDNL